jgi:hypothetical protein
MTAYKSKQVYGCLNNLPEPLSTNTSTPPPTSQAVLHVAVNKFCPTRPFGKKAGILSFWPEQGKTPKLTYVAVPATVEF